MPSPRFDRTKNEILARASEEAFLNRLEELARSRKYGAIRHLINLRREFLAGK